MSLPGPIPPARVLSACLRSLTAVDCEGAPTLHSALPDGVCGHLYPRAARLTIPLNRGIAAMAKSDLLRFQDVRDAYRLIGECRDLGSDPAPWQRRRFGGLGRLTGAPAAASPGPDGSSSPTPSGTARPLSTTIIGRPTSMISSRPSTRCRRAGPSV